MLSKVWFKSRKVNDGRWVAGLCTPGHPGSLIRSVGRVLLGDPTLTGANPVPHPQPINYVDHRCYVALDRWVKRRHPNKNRHWQQSRYFCQVGGDRWRFYAPTLHHGESARILLTRVSSVKIQRHIKIQAKATPYDPMYGEYFAKRLAKPSTRSCSVDTGSFPGF